MSHSMIHFNADSLVINPQFSGKFTYFGCDSREIS